MIAKKKRKPQIGKILQSYNKDIKIVIFTESSYTIGEGSYGKCYLGKIYQQEQKPDNFQIDAFTQNLVVVKEMSKKKTREDVYNRQIQNLSKVFANNVCQNLVKAYPSKWESDTNYYIVMQYCHNASLDRYIQKRKQDKKYFNFYQICQIMTDILDGYKQLKKYGIIHEDLKPQNIFIKNKYFKIGDFGLSFKFGSNKKKHRGGTRSYNALQKYEDKTPNHKSDIYAIGVIFYQLLFGKHPYFTQQQYQSYFITEIDKYSWINNENIPNIALERIKIKNSIFVGFLKTRTLKQFNPIVNVGAYKDKFERLVQIIKQMCQLNQHQRYSFELVSFKFQQLKLSSLFLREDLFKDLQQLRKSEFDFQLQNLIIQGKSQLIGAQIKVSINNKFSLLRQVSNNVGILRSHLLQTSFQIHLLSDLINYMPDDEQSYFVSNIQQFKKLCYRYIYLLNQSEIIFAKNKMAKMKQIELQELYSANIDSFLKVFKQNHQFLSQQMFYHYTQNDLKKAKQQFLLNIKTSLSLIILNQSNYQDGYILLLIYQILLESSDYQSDPQISRLGKLLKSIKEKLLNVLTNKISFRETMIEFEKFPQFKILYAIND